MMIGFGAIPALMLRTEPASRLRLSVSIGAMALLAGCDVATQQPKWTECVSARTGEHVQVIDNWENRPHVRDKNGFIFRVDPEGSEWRCKLSPGWAP